MAFNTQTLPSNGSIFAGTTPTNIISPTGVATQPDFQFANSPLPADTSSNTVGGLNLNNLQALFRESEALGQQALVNPNVGSVMPRSTGEFNIVLTPEVLAQLEQQTPDAETTEAIPPNVEKELAQLRTKINDFEKQQAQQPRTVTETALSTSKREQALKAIEELNEKIAYLEGQNSLNQNKELTSQIAALKDKVATLEKQPTLTTKAPPSEKPKTVAQAPKKPKTPAKA